MSMEGMLAESNKVGKVSPEINIRPPKNINWVMSIFWGDAATCLFTHQAP